MNATDGAKALIKIADELAVARKVLVRLRHVLKNVRALEDVAELATLQLKTRNLNDDIETAAQELNAMESESRVMSIKLKRFVTPIDPDKKSPRLIYSESTPMQRRFMREGKAFPDDSGYTAEKMLPPEPPRELLNRIPL